MAAMFRPMLAFDADFDYYARKMQDEGRHFLISGKMDGIRAIVKNGQLVSRTLKPIRNARTQALFGRPELEGLDGELIVGDPYGEGVFARTSSGVMSADGIPDVTFWVVDDLSNPRQLFIDRYQSYVNRVSILGLKLPIEYAPQTRVTTPKQLEEYEEEFTQKGYEGLILKSPNSPYKFGRATAREGYMGKLKRFVDSEAMILGFEEMMHNDNAATTDPRGFTVRSSHKANQRPAGMLGTLQVRDLAMPSWLFGIGSGFDHALRQKIWNNREVYRGKIVKYKYLPVGMVDVPRHPIFLGFRDPIDI